MFTSVLIAGYGYLGQCLANRFLSLGVAVTGLSRSPIPQPSKVKLIQADLTQPSTLADLPAVEGVVLCQAPGPGEGYEKTYGEGTRNLLKALKAKGVVRKIIFISSTSVYSTPDGSWVDETTPPERPGFQDAQAAEQAAVLLKAENDVLSSGIASCVIRSAGIYGPGRNRILPIREGRFQPRLSPEWINRIHAEDLASAIIVVLEKGQPGQVYIACDDEPTPTQAFYTWLYAQMGLPAPKNGEDALRRTGSSKRCRNERLKRLGWSPVYRSYREGYTELLKGVLR